MNPAMALRAKKIRAYIIAHPGCTREKIHAAHPGENLNGGFQLLEKHRLARYEGGGKKGPARWYPTCSNIMNRDPVKPEDY